jgi:hypothetical protein
MEYTKDLLDRINFAHLKQFRKDDPFGNSTHSITVYDAMVVFERRPKAHDQWARTGKQGSLGKQPFTPGWPQHEPAPSPVPVADVLEPDPDDDTQEVADRDREQSADSSS